MQTQWNLRAEGSECRLRGVSDSFPNSFSPPIAISRMKSVCDPKWGNLRGKWHCSQETVHTGQRVKKSHVAFDKQCLLKCQYVERDFKQKAATEVGNIEDGWRDIHDISQARKSEAVMESCSETCPGGRTA